MGSYIPFGHYPINTKGESQPLVWLVLTVKNGKALLITDKLIDAVPYNTTYTDVTWETCTLRKWLNHDFLNAAFTNTHQSQIATVTNPNADNPKFRTMGGNPTQDKIFVLSIDEAKTYFQNNVSRMAAVTPYAMKQGSYYSDQYTLSNGEKPGWWWLRSLGMSGFGAVYVDRDGSILEYGGNITHSNGSVRPAFWLNL